MSNDRVPEIVLMENGSMMYLRHGWHIDNRRCLNGLLMGSTASGPDGKPVINLTEQEVEVTVNMDKVVMIQAGTKPLMTPQAAELLR